jgi:hypothetical protein
MRAAAIEETIPMVIIEKDLLFVLLLLDISITLNIIINIVRTMIETLQIRNLRVFILALFLYCPNIGRDLFFYIVRDLWRLGNIKMIIIQFIFRISGTKRRINFSGLFRPMR